MKNPVAKIYTTKGVVTIELFPNEAPNSVHSFIWCAKQGFYNNRTIRRIEPDFVIEPSYSHFDDKNCDFMLDGEFDTNGKPNAVKLQKGSLALSGDGKAESHGCEFFFVLSDKAGERLQGDYPGFAKVIDGYEVVEALTDTQLKEVFIEEMNFYVHEAVTPEIMEKVEVETFGVDYPQPQIKYWVK